MDETTPPLTTSIDILAAPGTGKEITEASLLGSNQSVNLLLVQGNNLGADGSSSGDGISVAELQTFMQRLGTLGHYVATATPQNWAQVLEESVVQILFYAPGASWQHDSSTIADLKTECVGQDIVLVMLASSTASVADWQRWHLAGADAMFQLQSSDTQLQACVEEWVNFAQVKRELQSLRETLGKQVQTDELTQLLNRRHFFQSAHREVSRARRYYHPISCLMIDINHFRLINTTYGYACGDYVLRRIAGIIREWTRESDVVARFGAKKFVVLLPETDVRGAMLLREKLQREINETKFAYQGQQLPVTVSIGEAQRQVEAPTNPTFSFPDLHHEGEQTSGDTEEETISLSVREELAELLEDADAALYVAKKGVRQPAFNPPAPDESAIGILGSS